MTMLYDMHYHLKIKDLDSIGHQLKSLVARDTAN